MPDSPDGSHALPVAPDPARPGPVTAARPDGAAPSRSSRSPRGRSSTRLAGTLAVALVVVASATACDLPAFGAPSAGSSDLTPSAHTSGSTSTATAGPTPSRAPAGTGGAATTGSPSASSTPPPTLLPSGSPASGAATPAPSAAPAPAPPRPAGPTSGSAPTSPATTVPPATTMPPSASGKYIWAAPDGNDNARGTSEQPFRSLQRAVDSAAPGDTVLARSGTYPSAPGRGSALILNASGREGRPITVAAAPGATPVIVPVDTNWNAVAISGSWITVQGFTIAGTAKSISLDFAMSQKTNADNPRTSLNGINVSPPPGRPDQHPTHILISGNTVRDCPGGGIGSQNSDYVTIRGNTVSGSSQYSPWGTSPVGYLSPFNSDANTGTKMVFEDNEVFDNRQLVPWKDRARGQNLTEGHGIILDSGKADKGDGPYRGRTMVKGNRLYDNGGSGVNVFNSDHADVVGNTSTHNRTNLPDGAEINVSGSTDVRVADNVITPSSGVQPVSTRPTAGVVVQNNRAG